MTNNRYTGPRPSAFLLRTLLLLLTIVGWCGGASAQEYVVRYVSSTGAFSNDGTSWEQAKNNLQNAIDDLYDEIKNTGKKGYVFVQGSEEGTEYVPSRRATDDADGSAFNTSFRVYAGIYVFGGFKGDEEPDDPDHPELLPRQRVMSNGETYAEMESDISDERIEETARRWDFKHKTILNGNHSTTPYTFRFDASRGVYNTSFPLSSYHVVWFGTNGKIVPTAEGEEDLTGHFAALADTALVDGCTIEGGYASSTNLNEHDHTGFGGGVYMVKKSVLKNCVVHHCSAMQRGGAVYQDGGGEVDQCYIHTSQATGYGMQQGYGGGVCIDYDGAVRHSYITQCASRIGAGLAICHVPNEYPEQTVYPVAEDRADPYNPYAMSTVISNCTSNAEGAGVYLDEGGTLNHVSVVNNKCIGPDVIYYGRRHGRTGGIYVRNGGTIYNTVAWGNESQANNDVQFAAFKNGDRHISLYHSAFSKSDITDWAAASKENICSLENDNFPSPEHKIGNFPMFSQPTAAAGIQYGAGGVVDPTATADGQPYQDVYNWHPLALSDLKGKAVQVTDAVHGVADEILHAHTDEDVVGREFEAISSCGALAHSYRTIEYVLLPTQEKVEGRQPGETVLIPTLFVDPNMKVAGDTNSETETGYQDNQHIGQSWTHPMGNLADAINFFKEKLHDTNFTKEDYTAHPERTYYDLDGTHYQHVQILVKEGKMTVAGRGSYVSGYARTASLRPGSNMRLYGAFPKSNAGTDQGHRDPFEWNSDMTADVLGGGFDNNAVHVVAIANQHNVIIDGFRLHSGNANVAPAPEGDPDHAPDEWKTYHALADGGGLVVNNAMTANPAKRRDMTGNILRNVVIANCAAPEGAAVYVGGGFLRGTADGSAVSTDLCKAELTMVNVIVRNCTAGDIYGDPDRFVTKTPEQIAAGATNQYAMYGIVTANGDAKVVLRNCDIVNNCGFPLVADTTFHAGERHYGKLEIYNSLIFSNGLQIHADRTAISSSVFCTRESYSNILAKNVYMGYDVLLPNITTDPRFPQVGYDVTNLREGCHRVLTFNRNEDGSRQRHKKDNGARGFIDASEPECDEVTVYYPVFVNPSRNVGHATGDDQSYYGGRVNYEPLPTNPIVNAGNTTLDSGTGATGTEASMSYDMGLRQREYGGDPDVGAIETQRLPKAGAVIYVTPEGAGRRDGSSWANAIQGNAIYALNGGAAGTDAIDEQNGARITNTDPTIGTLTDGGVPTTDERYCGGFARSWFKERRTGAATTTTVTDTWTIEKNVYDDGHLQGQEEIIRNDTEPTRSTKTVITNNGTAEGGFTSGWADDERYPYGELSGQSRAFWRATDNYTPIPEWWTLNSFKSTDTRTDSYTGETVTGIGTGTFEEIISDPERGIKIRNNRTENYVGGLQYAVERAAAYNALAANDPGRISGIDSVQVWVSNGTYTDYKGFIMRDNTVVLGSFPAKDGGTPGLNERQALMSAVISIPKSLPAQELNPEDYETILQISDVNPKAANDSLNMAAVKFWDDDYTKMTATDTKTYEYKTRTIVHHYSYFNTGLNVDKTDDYVQYSDMTTNGTTNVWASRTTTNADGIRYYAFGTATSTKDCWHISVPVDNVGKRIGNCNGNGGDIFENGTKVGTAGQRAHIRDGSLTGVNIWQTLKDVPVGTYMVKMDMAAFYYDTYKNLTGNAGNPNTNVTLQILDASDNVLTSTPISYYHNGRGNMNRYTLTFTQATAGDVTVKVVVGPGLDLNGNEVADDYTLAMNQNPNRREINMDNLKFYQLIQGEGYTELLPSLTDVTVDRAVENPEPSVVTAGTAYTVTKHRTTLRKRVLQMPDKSNPVYGGGGYFGDPSQQAGVKITTNADNVAHSERVNDSRRKANNQYIKYNDPDFDWYDNATWDGFTIRHGFIHDFAMCHGGGAGVSMYEGAHLKNCIITDNIVACEREKGGGVFVDGATASVEGCFILNNTSTRSKDKYEQSQVFAGGMFMYEGTCYNTLIANNYSHSNGGGLGLCVGRFYNNTIAYNTCRLSDGGGGLRIATGADSYILMANSIIYGNSGLAISMTNTSSFSPFLHCYIQSSSNITDSKIKTAIMAPSNSTDPDETEKISGGRGWKNKFLNSTSPSLANTPFEADVVDGAYTGGSLTANDYRLREDFTYCINKGTEDFQSTMYNALRRVGTSGIETNPSYVFASDVELPDNDVAFAERIQDCQVDIGAYEFDGTRAIEPTLFPNETPKKAIFYVTQSGAGLATAENPVNAACYLKLQKVLDAAGRWRYASYKYDDDDDETQLQNNFNVDMLRHELLDAGVGNNINAQAISNELRNLKDYEVIVQLEGDNGSHFHYIPTRNTNLNTTSVNDLEKSLIVPRGIRVEGGYESTFSQDRDILGRPTRFSGEIVNETLGTSGSMYHVITFTNTLFDVDERPFSIKDGSAEINLTDQLEFLGDRQLWYPDNYNSLSDADKETAETAAQAVVENHRAVMDGLFIQDGSAHGTTTEHKIGGGCVVTEYAHLRNCVILNNSAAKYGGGVYLQPRALISGCIVKNNEAQQGGGIYVEEPVTVDNDTYAHVISTTVVDNEATQNAGGLWFSTNLRANSSAFWRNSASDYGNVAGTFSTGLTQLVENYPLNYCGVGSSRVAGVNNIELPTAAVEGVRWDPTMPYELGIGHESVYFPITVSSVLGRSGMTYPAYEEFREKYPTLELTDIFGLNRMEQIEEEDMTLANGSTYTKHQKNNAFIEMGARAMNGNFEVKTEYSHVMTRLFVTTTERLPTEAALALQNNTVSDQWALDYPNEPLPSSEQDARYVAVKDKVEMYKQMGSSFLNPFHRLGEALEYIIKVRKEMTENYELGVKIGDHYKDVRFEIFICGGTFYPFRNAHGEQGETRANTFVVPEEVTIVGGVNHQAAGHAYCQATEGTLQVAGYTLNPATTYEIRTMREHMDRNGNHVKEPWELTEQTILSGHAVQNDQNTNVYHVITCFPDVNQVGQLPTRKDASGTVLSPMPSLGVNPSTGELLDNIEQESRDSRDQRTIIIDGVTITGGYANKIDPEDEESNFQKLTYFRGGGIFVDGNWDDSFDEQVDLPEVLGVAKRNIPLILTACNIKDNVAGNGGGVYTNGTFFSFSCHFTKNLAIGPEIPADQKYIPWSAGGAIANNYECHLWNSLFDNNEAQRSLYDIRQGSTPMRTEGGKNVMNPVENSNERQGYGGTISCSETGLARICNCDFVRNKAVAFPALYNFIDNNLRAASSGYASANPHYYGKGWHFAVNTIFWGNTATASEVTLATGWEKEYYQSLFGVTDDFIDRRKPWHVANFAPMLDVATLTFCSLEEGSGREGTVWYANHDRAKQSPIKPKDYGDGQGEIDGLTRLYQGRFTDVLDDYFGYYPDGYPIAPYYKKEDGMNLPCAVTYDHIWWDDPNDDPDQGERELGSLTELQQLTAVPYNYNLVLEKQNAVPGGPYFVQPSLTAGIDGYMETADWLVARLNNSIDTGWGYLKQQVTQESESSGLYSTSLLKGTDENNLSPVGDYDRFDHESVEEQYHDLFGEGFYNLHSKNIHARFHDMGYPNLLPIGDDYYMEYTREDPDGVKTDNMRRISTHPKMGVQDVFIDMGIYEYQYVQLVTPGDEIDVIWVAETQNEGVTCDGSTWYRATSDLQGAIETLLLSRNGHDKIIKLKGGTYSPNRMTGDNHKAFFINIPTKQDGVMLPGLLEADEVRSVKSLTFRGGYPSIGADDPLANFESDRSTDQYPVTFSMKYEIGNSDEQLMHLFIIEDVQKKGTYGNYLNGKNPYFYDEVTPIVFDGITFVNPYGNNRVDGGAALRYMEQFKTIDENNQFIMTNYHLKPASDGSPKLLAKNCTFMVSGKNSDVSAVNVGKGGGESLFVNCLFHSNSGNPIEGANTQLVNCTSALNGGHLKLTDEVETYATGVTSSSLHSGVYNSIIWMDDEAQTDGALKTMWEGNIDAGEANANLSTATDHYMKYNTFTEWQHHGDTHGWWYPVGYNMIYGTGNIRLSPDNNDVLLGPNFIDPVGVEPENGTVEEKLLAKKQSRNFRLNGSARTINQANVETYRSLVPYYKETWTQEQKTSGEGENAITYYFHSVQRDNYTTLTDNQLKGTATATPPEQPHAERELDFKPRWDGTGIERGAYECTAAVQRVLYVMDGPTGKRNGTSWEHAFDLEQLQRAVDVASVYSVTSSPQERAYVFVRAANYTSDTPLKLRDGVSVYGGITNVIDTVAKTNGAYLDADINAYVTKMKSERNGVATDGAAHNVVKGLVADNGSDHNDGFLLDGFWIQGGESETTPVDMTRNNTVLVNDIITGNTVTTAGQPVVAIGGTGTTKPSLLYNTLIYGNTAGSGVAVVTIGDNGYALNNTIVAANAGETALSVLSGTADSKARNNIAVNESSSRAPMFAPYQRTGANVYTPAVHHTRWQPYWYQLHEQSNEIDAGTVQTSAGTGITALSSWLPAALQPFVNFNQDRDVLGNPRQLRGKVDNGCFETWRVTGDRYVTNKTNTTVEGGFPAFTRNYGGHLYPHVGSVVYLDENANMIVNKDGDAPLFTAVNALSPGYVLLKKGASIYGQGNTLRFPYVAAEKEYTGQQYVLMAFPFEYYVADAVSTSHSGSDALTQTAEGNSFTAYTYDGEKRSRWNYNFNDGSDPTNPSSCWTTVNRKITASEGWLLNFNSPATKTIRFTGWGDAEGSFIYNEEGGDKVVVLSQYNNNVVAGTGYPQFTKLEDMGWNLKGHPWLVSTFATDGVNPDYQMDVPHVFYSMNPTDGSYLRMSGQIYTSRSWDEGSVVRLGDAFFTQTAVIGESENLTFRLPVFGGTPVAPAKLWVALTDSPDDDRQLPLVGYADYVELHPSESANPAMPYRLGSDGLKWSAFDQQQPQLYVLNENETPLSLVGAAPVETDIRLGVNAAGRSTLTIAMPSPESFADYGHVWLTDHAKGIVTDLMQQSYSFKTGGNVSLSDRFTLRIGSRPDVEEAVRPSYQILIRKQHLTVKGLTVGDRISIYTAGGALVTHATAADTEYHADLADGIYVVRVNGMAKKVESHR